MACPMLGKAPGWLQLQAGSAHEGLLPLAVINTVVGQASFGPPASASLTIIEAPLPHDRPLVQLSTEELVFVGSVSPGGHFLSLLVAAQRLVDVARYHGARVILVDTSGLAGPGLGFQLKLRKVELLLPDHLVALLRSKAIRN